MVWVIDKFKLLKIKNKEKINNDFKIKKIKYKKSNDYKKFKKIKIKKYKD